MKRITVFAVGQNGSCKCWITTIEDRELLRFTINISRKFASLVMDVEDIKRGDTVVYKFVFGREQTRFLASIRKG